jgi:cation:H+ antiporter
MPPTFHHLGLFLGGLVLLLVGGKMLVSASVDIARRLGVPPLLVGLTLVAWGTSAPELSLNLVSAWKGRGDLALGNVIGANICNMGLVLGVCALMRPLRVQEQLIRIETNLNAAMLSLMAVFGLAFRGYERWESLAMLLTFSIYATWTIIAGLKKRTSQSALVPTEEPAGYPTPPMSWWRIGIFLIAGLALLTLGGSMASDAAVDIATTLGVPNGVVAVTIVSMGTTLPELITGVMAVRRGQVDLAMGNAIGSCLFNAGAIFGLAATIAPPHDLTGVGTSLVTMLVLALVLLPISRTFHRHIARIEGAALLGVYVLFLALQAMIALRARG